MTQRKPLIGFIIIAFGLAWILFLLPLAFGTPGSMTRQVATTVFFALAMWAPGLGAIVATKFIAGESLQTLNLRRLGNRRMYLWALLLPPLLAIATGILTWGLGAGELDLSFTLMREAMAEAPGSEGVPLGIIVGIQVLFSLTLAPFINTVFALGEELGWRGFLLPRLLPRGKWRAILGSSAIWGIWHAPAVLQGLNYPNRPVLGVLMMIAFTLLLGVFMSWLYLETRSPWAPALAHGAVNATAGLPMLFLSGVDISIGGTLASIIGWIPLAILVGWLVLTGRLPRPMNSQRSVEPYPQASSTD